MDYLRFSLNMFWIFMDKHVPNPTGFLTKNHHEINMSRLTLASNVLSP